MELFYVGYVKGTETEFELLVSFCSTHEFQNGVGIPVHLFRSHKDVSYALFANTTGPPAPLTFRSKVGRVDKTIARCIRGHSNQLI